MLWIEKLITGIVIGLWLAAGVGQGPMLGAEPTSPAVGTGASGPNVLFLFTDDQRADTIAALGHPAIITPHLDQLAKSGLVFTNNYCLGGNSPAVCLPSRNMLLSGRTYFRFPRMAEREKPNFAASMKALGYETYHHGKRGNTARLLHQEFDHSKYLDDEADRTSGEPGKIIVDDAISFLGSRSREKPFFLYLAFANPHDPRVAAPSYHEAYANREIPLPANYQPIHPFDNGEMTIRDEALAPWPRTEAVVRQELKDYYATITATDHHIGRLLEHLREAGQYDKTLILFSSDHGLAIGSHGLMGKQNVYEDGMKAPLIVSGPGITAGRTDVMVYLMDLFPTVVDFLGGVVPEGLDGRSFAPVLRRERDTARDAILLAYRDVQRAVRVGAWKMIVYPEIHRTQLFDLEADPHETRDLAGEPEQASRIAALIGRLKALQREAGDTLALRSNRPKPAAWTPPKS